MRGFICMVRPSVWFLSCFFLSTLAFGDTATEQVLRRSYPKVFGYSSVLEVLNRNIAEASEILKRLDPIVDTEASVAEEGFPSGVLVLFKAATLLTRMRLHFFYQAKAKVLESKNQHEHASRVRALGRGLGASIKALQADVEGPYPDLTKLRVVTGLSGSSYFLSAEYPRALWNAISENTLRSLRGDTSMGVLPFMRDPLINLKIAVGRAVPALVRGDFPAGHFDRAIAALKNLFWRANGQSPKYQNLHLLGGDAAFLQGLIAEEAGDFTLAVECYQTAEAFYTVGV